MKIIKKLIILTVFLLSLCASAVFALTAEENGSINTSVIFGGEPDLSFSDVKPEDWFYDDVLYVFSNNIMSGISDSEFAPEEGLTRAMMITVLYRSSGEPAAKSSSFSDVADDAWYKDAVSWGAENKIISGTGENKFSPESLITREEMAVMLLNYSRLKNKSAAKADITSFADYSAVSPWAKDALSWAVANGLITGQGENMLAPGLNATRAEAAAILKRFLTL